jgi:hypothetical protein
MYTYLIFPIPMGHGEVGDAYAELVKDSVYGDKFKHGKPSKGAVQCLLERNDDILESTFPQNMEPKRAEWSTYENISDWFDVSRDAYLDAGVAQAHPKHAEEPEKYDEVVVEKKGNIGSCDEMPLWVNVNTGQKAKKDKKVVKLRAPPNKKAKSGRGAQQRRDKSRARQISTKYNKVGTFVGGSKADGEPLIPLVIIKGALNHSEYSYSLVSTKDGKDVKKVELSEVHSGGAWHKPKFVANSKGGMTPELWAIYLECCVAPCFPLMSPTNRCVFHCDGDGSHVLPAALRREWADKGLTMIFPKPDTSADTQGEDLVTYGIMQPIVREQAAKRQRYLRLIVKTDRQLDGKDVCIILKPAIDEGLNMKHNLDAWRTRGLVPFTRQPLQQPHILATKGKSKKRKVLNFEALDWERDSESMTEQVRRQLGKGVRLTSGWYSGRPYTSDEAIKMDMMLEKEKQEKEAAKVQRKVEREAKKEQKQKEKEQKKGGKKAATAVAAAIPCMQQWGKARKETWNDECDASDCDCEDDEHEVMCCYSCNVVMHPECAQQKGVDKFVNEEWLCVDCHQEYEGKKK